MTFAEKGSRVTNRGVVLLRPLSPSSSSVRFFYSTSAQAGLQESRRIAGGRGRGERSNQRTTPLVTSSKVGSEPQDVFESANIGGPAKYSMKPTLFFTFPFCLTLSTTI